MELIGANVFLFLSGIPLSRECKDKITQSFEQQITGKNFSEILTELRLEEAKKLLRSSNLKISQVAEQIGYPNLQYFIRVFTGQMNMTPAEYRKIMTYF